MIDVNAEVFSPYYDVQGRKYIDLIYDETVTRVKVPFRYNRVMCTVHGLKTIQEYQKGDKVHVLISERGWNNEVHPVLCSIREITS